MTLAVKPGTPPTPFTCRIGQGDMIMGPPSGETFNYIHGQFIVPTPSWPSSVGSASVWMGLDGCTYPVLPQAGADPNANDDGPKPYSPWYEWFPSAAIYFVYSKFSL
jgi:Peptidase A4 family